MLKRERGKLDRADIAGPVMPGSVAMEASGGPSGGSPGLSLDSGLGALVAWLPLAGPTIRLTRAVKPS